MLNIFYNLLMMINICILIFNNNNKDSVSQKRVFLDDNAFKASSLCN